MPKIVERLVRQLNAKGVKNARAVAVGTLQRNGVLKKGTTELTEYGKKRNSMSAGERAKSRAAKQNGGKPSDYKYDKRTNRATKK